MYKFISLLVTTSILIGSILLILSKVINLVVSLLCHKDITKLLMSIKRYSIVLLITVAISIFLVIMTQLTVSTPKIIDDNGRIKEGSIAELKKVALNGREEWISIRGVDQTKPIILFFAGGPGGSELTLTRYQLEELEKDYVIVNWEQPGSGKSYHCMNNKEITVDTYIEDGIALTEYLRKEFNQDKIYLMGESWGATLGIMLIDKKPQYYKGYIGAGPVIDFSETDIRNYEDALRIAEEEGNKMLVNTLKRQGKPPYTGKFFMKYGAFLSILNCWMDKQPVEKSSPSLGEYLYEKEYGLLDSINYFVGFMNTFNTVYPQLYDIDLRKTHTDIQVPIYLFLGRYDINAPTELAEDYYKVLNAPYKEIVWFEHSGHTAMEYEKEAFINEVRRCFAE